MQRNSDETAETESRTNLTFHKCKLAKSRHKPNAFYFWSSVFMLLLLKKLAKSDLPSGCCIFGVIALKKSSGVKNTSVLLPSEIRTVAKYRNILSGVEYCRILFSYSII